MTRILSVLLLSLVAVPASAQDDCPAGHVRNPAVSPLDHAYMLSAFKASFLGIKGFEPSCRPGSGLEDCEYYIGASNHYGVYGDDQCHAGWSGYWESWISTGHGDLALVQTPARFLPSAAPVPPPIPPQPPPVPAPTCDLAPIASSIAAMAATLNTHVASTESFQSDVRGWKGALLEFAAKYVLPLVGTYEICHQTGKC